MFLGKIFRALLTGTHTILSGLAGTTMTVADIKGKILSYLFHLQNEGYREATIKQKQFLLNRLMSLGPDLANPESVKKAIASLNTSESYKLLIAIAYEGFAKFNNISRTRPNYKQTEKLPFIPYETEIDALIAGCGRKSATLLQLLKETGMRLGEAWWLTWIDIDLKNNVVTCNNPEKNSRPRVFKVSGIVTAMVDQLKRKNKYVFGGVGLASTKNGF